MRPDARSWARFTARWILGLMFFMAGWYKVFEMGATEHARRYFVDGFQETWIPVWLLWSLGVTIPFVELIAGALVCLGLRLREALPALAAVLIIVTYGHLLLEPLFDTTAHIFPRFILLAMVWLVPAERDVLGIDHWLGRASAAPRRGGPPG